METEDLIIAIVSDLHCRHGKESQISTHLYTELPRNPKEHHPVESLKLLIKKDNITSDILLCPGDISDKADDQGLSTGWGFISEISKELNSYFYTSSVGNHDVKSRDTSNKNPFSYITSFNDDFPINDGALKDSFWSTEKSYFVYEDEKFILLNFNSSYNHIDKENALLSKITDEIISKMKHELLEKKIGNKYLIALFHHHPKPYANIEQLYKDGDIIDRGDKLLEMLNELNFDLVIHGHKHIPKLDFFISRLPVFCSGSFSSLMNIKDVSGKNTFHLIKLSKKSGFTQGLINTWEYTKGHGWMKAVNDIFFPWTTGFSKKLDLDDLESKIANWLSKKEKPLGYFSELVEDIEGINYLIPNEQDELTKKLLINHSIEFIPNLKLGPKMITIQKK